MGVVPRRVLTQRSFQSFVTYEKSYGNQKYLDSNINLYNTINSKQKQRSFNITKGNSLVKHKTTVSLCYTINRLFDCKGELQIISTTSVVKEVVEVVVIPQRGKFTFNWYFSIFRGENDRYFSQTETVKEGKKTRRLSYGGISSTRNFQLLCKR